MRLFPDNVILPLKDHTPLRKAIPEMTVEQQEKMAQVFDALHAENVAYVESRLSSKRLWVIFIVCFLAAFLFSFSAVYFSR